MHFHKRTWLQVLVTLALGLVLSAGLVQAQDAPEIPPAEILNDEGGPVSITGAVDYTNPFFTLGVAQPVVITEDQAGFVDRNEYFLMPEASQTLGQITTDFYTSPFTYSLALPSEPQGSYRDVDNDDEAEQGVQVYAIAYWTNTFGDAFLEERDLYGGGWSTAYASTRISTDPEKDKEIIGGKFLVYAPDDQQGFPAAFGEDGLLFTEDDPIVNLPAGYTVVDMDVDPFTFDRSRYPVIDLIEPDSAALVDLSDLPYDEAFNELVDILSREYAFTELKGINWEALRQKFLPRFAEAQATDNSREYRLALRDFAWSIPDGHISAPVDITDFRMAATGGIGIAIREVDDGRVIVNFLAEDTPAAAAGIELGTEITAINDVPIAEAIENAVAWSAPFSTEHFRRLQQMRYVTRFPVGEDVSVTFINAGGEEETAEMVAVAEPASFSSSSFNSGLTGSELPVEYELLDSGYGYVRIYSFSDNDLLSVQLWERMIQDLNQRNVPGLIVDMRQNGGGKGFLADQMAAYFFNEPLELGNTAAYDEERGEFYIDPRGEDRFYLPAEELRYNGPVAVIVGPNCASACEFFSYDMTLQNRASIVGQYPTAGLGGSVNDLRMPGNETFRYTVGRGLDPEGNIHIEGQGVAPTVLVPVTEETLFSEGDPILDAAINYLDEATTVDVTDGGDIALGDSLLGTVEANTVVQYTLAVAEGDVLNIRVTSDDFDPLLAIYDTNGNLLLANDDIEGSDTSDAGFEELAIPRDLVLVLEVASVTGSEAGSYVISVQAAPVSDSDEGTGAELTIIETASAAGDFEILLAALDMAGLTAELAEGGPYTVFAPNDDAFNRLGSESLGALLANPDVLAEVLQFHVVADAVSAAELTGLTEITPLMGGEISVELFGSDIVLNGSAEVIGEDILANNGVIHIIDAVLLPPGVELP